MYHILAWSLLIMSLILAASSQSLVFLWFSMEINLACFLFMTLFYTSDSKIITNYFLIQAFSGVWILPLVLCPSTVCKSELVALLLLVKLGSAPFHLWYIYLLKFLTWEILWVLSSLQKIIPLIFFMKMVASSKMVLSAGLVNLIASLMTSYMKKEMKIILASSTLFSLAWVFLLLKNNPWTSLMYFLLYSLMLGNLVFFLKTNTPSSDLMNHDSPSDTQTLMVSLLVIASIMSLPPLLGFLTKVSILQLVPVTSTLVMNIYMATSIYLMFMYLSVMTQVLMTHSPRKVSFLATTTKAPHLTISTQIILLCASNYLLT